MSILKIVPLERLPVILAFPERRRVKVVQAHGCWDCLHVGHLFHFEQAKSYGDILIVTVTSDCFVNKGSGRPIFSDELRARMVAALSVVDFVAISDYPDASIPISLIKPDIFVKGCDYFDKGTSDVERDAVNEVGGKLQFTTTEKFSTTEIISRLIKCFMTQ